MSEWILSLHSLCAKLSICPEPFCLQGMPRHWGGHQMTPTAFHNLVAWWVVIFSSSRVGSLKYETLWVSCGSAFCVCVCVSAHTCALQHITAVRLGDVTVLLCSQPLLDTSLLHLSIQLKTSAALKPLISVLQGHSTVFLNRSEVNLEELLPFPYFSLVCRLVWPQLFSLLSTVFKQNF